MSPFLIGFILIGIITLVVVIGYRQLLKSRHSGLLAKAGEVTMADVERLVRAGEKILAIR